MKVKVYVEGGGDTEELQARCREAFRKLLEKAGLRGQMPRIVACGGRGATFEDFRTAQEEPYREYFPILLVDSEAPVRSAPWKHLHDRDGWTQPEGAEDLQAQLMVVCMETWVVADREALRRVFGKKELIEGQLPPENDLEARSKEDVQDRLQAATRGCPRTRRYTKGRRSFQIVGELNPATLERLLPHFKRLIETLRELR